MLGLPLDVAAGVVVAFILFGQALYAVGGDKFLTDLALIATGRYRGGPAKVSVVSSALFGTVSGSAVANVVVDGAITIPLMKSVGFPGHMAAAIEAVASNGGQIMPPVMGAAAFLMAEFLNIPYGQVALAAAVPACLYYLALFTQIDLESAKRGLLGLPRRTNPQVSQRHPLGLGVSDSVIDSRLHTDDRKLGSRQGRHGRGHRRLSRRRHCRKRRGHRSRKSSPLSKKPARSFSTSPSSRRWPASSSARFIFPASLLKSHSCSSRSPAITFSYFYSSPHSDVYSSGLPLPTTVVYITLAVLAAPALVQLGIPPLAAHLFLFYFGMVSLITPPDCLPVYIAASIARANFWQTGWTAMRLGIAAYFVPFIFALHPPLILMGTLKEILIAIITAVHRRDPARRRLRRLFIPPIELDQAWTSLVSRSAPAPSFDQQSAPFRRLRRLRSWCSYLCVGVESA